MMMAFDEFGYGRAVRSRLRKTASHSAITAQIAVPTDTSQWSAITDRSASSPTLNFVVICLFRVQGVFGISAR